MVRKTKDMEPREVILCRVTVVRCHISQCTYLRTGEQKGFSNDAQGPRGPQGHRGKSLLITDTRWFSRSNAHISPGGPPGPPGGPDGHARRATHEQGQDSPQGQQGHGNDNHGQGQQNQGHRHRRSPYSYYGEDLD